MPVRIAPLHVLAWQSVSEVKWLHFIEKNNARVSSHLREGTMEVLRSLFAKTTVALKLEDPLTVGVIVWYFYITTACFYRQDLRMCARPRSANRVNFEENIHCKKKLSGFRRSCFQYLPAQPGKRQYTTYATCPIHKCALWSAFFIRCS